MLFVKRHLAAVVAGLVIAGGASYVATAGITAGTDDQVVLTQDQSAREPGDAPKHGRPTGGFPRAIRGELTIHARDGEGFADVRFDRGVIARVDGTTIVITEDDGSTVEVEATDETRIGRDGKKATLADLKADDHVSAFRIDEGDGYVTKGVRAISPERWASDDEKREECRSEPVRCRHEMRQRFRDRSDGDAA